MVRFLSIIYFLGFLQILLCFSKVPVFCVTLYFHCLVSVNVQEASMNFIGCNLFPYGRIKLHSFASYALPCQTPFCHTAPLLSSVARQKNLTEYWREGSTLLPYHQHPSLTSWANIIKKEALISERPSYQYLGEEGQVGGCILSSME